MKATRSTLQILMILMILMSLLSALLATTARAQSLGTFVYAGPVSTGDTDAMRVQWRFAIRLAVKIESIKEIEFFCNGIPETKVAAKRADLRYTLDGDWFIYSKPEVVSPQSTQWLYSPGTTATNCEAIATLVTGEKLREAAPVTFTAAMKSTTLNGLQRAFEHNKKLESK